MIRFDDILERVSSSYSEQNIILLKKAYVFAAQAHKGQVRRSGEPYMSHPLEVTRMLAELKLDPVTLAAGLLHDVLEDTDVKPEDLRKAFGQEISDLVEGVTKISRVQQASPETRQAETIQKIILAMTDDLRVIFIKLADRVHNLSTLKFLPEDKQKQVAQETLEIYAPIANKLGMGRIKAELEDLSFRYVAPDEYFKMAALVEPRRKKAEKEIQKIKAELEALMRENNIPAEIFSRIKRLYSIYSKMRRRSIDFDQVYDFMAVRIITDSVKNCYAALGIIHQKWPHFPHRFHDFISMPKPNLYQALHTTIITQSRETVEIQIRTQAMQRTAVDGIAAHWKYKEKDPHAIIEEDARLLWLREMVELYREEKSPRAFLKDLKIHLTPEEVYVFTPKGKVVTLPHGATALDFAFKIHSEIGLHAHEAVVNGKKVLMKTPLKTGDIVEIIPSPEVIPGRDWLNKVVTSRARHHIKRWLNQKERDRNIALGKRMWEKAAKALRLPSKGLDEKTLLERVSASSPFRVRDFSDFYALLGSGKLLLDKRFLQALVPDQEKRERKAPLLRRVAARVSKKPRPLIEVKGETASYFRLARCCAPIKGEPIIGYITSGKGISVHAQRCWKVQRELLDPHRLVEASWSSGVGGAYRANLAIRSADTPGVLAKLTTEIAQHGGNIARASVETSHDKTAQIRLSVIIQDIEQLNRIIKNVREIKEISSVDRV
ncbi:MAG: RelA/SpoT family protein [Candidatus Aminicenantales bacterium]